MRLLSHGISQHGNEVELRDTHQSNPPFTDIYESRHCPSKVSENMHMHTSMLTHFCVVLARGVSYDFSRVYLELIARHRGNTFFDVTVTGQ